METVLKVGGSLAEDNKTIKALCHQLGLLAKTHEIVVVPGGGKFADTVREFDKNHGLSDVAAHKMAILAMDQYGLFLSDITSNSYVVNDLKQINEKMGNLPILLPSKLMFQDNTLENSWDITSDSIAAHVAGLLDVQKLVLVTDVDGVFTEDPKQNEKAELVKEISAKELQSWDKRTSVDKVLPKIVLENSLDCYVVNGKHPERITAVLENKKTVCTHVTV
ncbi:MAG: hypothetical protein NWF03_05860 [Candidatus Bathyarchaeota archaeon]|nr:hypothetical protein [Candidatus Bathyarchaeota archaeon]